MPTEHDISELVKSSIQMKIIEAFRSTPEMIDALVKSALEQPVNERGSTNHSYGDRKMPYLEYYVGETIRDVVRNTVRELVEENKNNIKEVVAKKFTADVMVDGLFAKMLESLKHDYNVKIIFDKEETKY